MWHNLALDAGLLYPIENSCFFSHTIFGSKSNSNEATNTLCKQSLDQVIWPSIPLPTFSHSCRCALVKDTFFPIPVDRQGKLYDKTAILIVNQTTIILPHGEKKKKQLFQIHSTLWNRKSHALSTNLGAYMHCIEIQISLYVNQTKPRPLILQVWWNENPHLPSRHLFFTTTGLSIVGPDQPGTSAWNTFWIPIRKWYCNSPFPLPLSSISVQQFVWYCFFRFITK